MTKEKHLQIRNSTAEFLVFTSQTGGNTIKVRVQDHTVWLMQKAMAELFDVDRTVVTKHLGNIFEANELQEDSVCANFAHTAADGKNYQTKFYNLDAIISIGYRINLSMDRNETVTNCNGLKMLVPNGIFKTYND